MEGHFHIRVALGGLKPLLQTLAAIPVLRTGLECVAPDLLTQISGGGENIRERAAGRLYRAAVFPCRG